MPLAELVAAILELPVSDVHDELGPATFGGWTSLKHLQLAVAIQDNYGFSLSMAEIRSITSVALIRDLLSVKGVTP